VQRFVLKAVRIVLDRRPTEEVDAVLQKALAAEEIQTFGFQEEVRSLFGERAKAWLPGMETYLSESTLTSASALSSKASNAWWFPDPSQEFAAAFRKIFSAVLAAGGDGRDIRTGPQISAVQLSGFLRICGIMESPLSDIYIWTEPFDENAITEVFRGLIAVSALDPVGLATDLRQMLRTLAICPAYSRPLLQLTFRNRNGRKPRCCGSIASD
jgi:hypothetical protein